MKPPAPSSHSMLDLWDFTPARVGLGRAGASMPTKALLEFTLDHARARDAVHAAFDVPAMVSGLGDLGLEAFDVASLPGSGLGYDEAAFKIAWLIREGLAREVTGVALKDESGGRMSQRVMIHSSRHDKSEI